jgi:DHA2 family multidrug resistance protein
LAKHNEARVAGDSAPSLAATLNDAPPSSSSVPWGISLAVILGSLTSSVMMGSVNIALPTMMTHLRADVTQIQWVLTAFMITRTVMMPTLGWAGGQLGNRQLYLTSLSVYIVASMLCGLAWSLPSMIAFRVLQGFGAGYLMPLGMTILYEAYPSGKRGMAMGILMAGMSFGPAIGPALGGYLVENLSWRAVFYINLPIGLIALTAATATLPRGGRQPSRKLDVLGLTTIAAFVVSLLLAVSQVRHYGWGSTFILALLSMSGVSLLAFIAAELTYDAPLVNMQVFMNIPFVIGALVTFLVSFANFAMNFVVALFLQQALRFNAEQAGLLMLPAAFVWGLTSLGAGRLADHVQGRWLILAGSLLLSLVFYSFVRVDIWSGAGVVIVLLIGRSLGRGFIQSPMMALIMSTLPDHQVRLGAGLRGLLNSLGGTFGVGLASFFLQQRLTIRIFLLVQNQQQPPLEHTLLLADLHEHLRQTGTAPALLSTQINMTLQRWLLREATITAYHDMFVFTAAMVFLTAIPVLMLRQQRGGKA